MSKKKKNSKKGLTKEQVKRYLKIGKTGKSTCWKKPTLSEIAAYKKKRKWNRKQIIQIINRLDNPANRAAAQIPSPPNCSVKAVSKSGILDRKSDRYWVYVPSTHTYFEYGTQGWENRARFVYRIHKKIKRIAPGYEIHHIDGDRYNDDPNNLRAVKPAEHRKIHAQKKADDVLQEKWVSLCPYSATIYRSFEKQDKRLPFISPAMLEAAKAISSKFHIPKENIVAGIICHFLRTDEETLAEELETPEAA